MPSCSAAVVVVVVVVAAAAAAAIAVYPEAAILEHVSKYTDYGW